MCMRKLSDGLKNKKEPETGPDSLVVDPSEKTWNTFFEIIFEWASILRQIYC